MTANSLKASGAFRTIGEVSRETGIGQHILRYWEARFPQLRPVTRAGNRRYYRPEDIALVRRIDSLLNEQGYTVKGAQQLLVGAADRTGSADSNGSVLPPTPLAAIRDGLARALADDGQH